MDEAVRNALIQIRKSQDAIARAEQFISAYEDFSGTKVDRNAMLSRPAAPAQVTISSGVKAGKTRRRNNPERIAQAAARVIRGAGRPMQRGELADAIEAGGLEIYSEDKPRYLGTILWRNQDMFLNLDGRGYITKALYRELGMSQEGEDKVQDQKTFSGITD